MKALSIMQPWASLIVGSDRAEGPKRVENRTWKPPPSMLGERFAIHASKKIDVYAFISIRDRLMEIRREEIPYATPKEFPTSAIIGTAVLDTFVWDGTGMLANDIARQLGGQQRWFVGPVGFVLADVKRIEPITGVKGALGFWRVGEEHEREVLARLARRAA